MACEVHVDEIWLSRREQLNDVRVTTIRQNGDELLIGIRNEWAGLEGTPEYPGPSKGVLVAEGLREAPRYDEFALKERIYEAHLTPFNQGYVFRIVFYGQHVLEANCEKMIWRPCLDK